MNTVSGLLDVLKNASIKLKNITQVVIYLSTSISLQIKKNPLVIHHLEKPDLNKWNKYSKYTWMLHIKSTQCWLSPISIQSALVTQMEKVFVRNSINSSLHQWQVNHHYSPLPPLIRTVFSLLLSFPLPLSETTRQHHDHKTTFPQPYLGLNIILI